APGPAAGSPGQARRSRLDDAGLQPGQLAVGRLAHDVDVLLRLVPDPEDLHPRQVLLDRLPEALRPLPVLRRPPPPPPPPSAAPASCRSRLAVSSAPLSSHRNAAKGASSSLGIRSPLLALCSATSAGCFLISLPPPTPARPRRVSPAVRPGRRAAARRGPRP